MSGWKGGAAGKGEIDTWLHTKCLPLTVWRHPFPMIVVIEDKQTKAKVAHVWSRNHTCHETESVLETMYWRETKGDPSSPRKSPPERCGLCKSAEYMWQACWRWLATHRWAKDKENPKAGKWVLNAHGKELKAAGQSGPATFGLDPCAVLFKFVSEAEEYENTTIHVGGFCGIFGRDDLPEDLLKAMAQARISPKEAWKETGMVKPRSVMCVVDNDKPERGVQVSEETKDLGEKVKEKITEVLDGSQINIMKRPYCIKWKYDRSKPMGKQYAVTAMLKIKPTPRILEVIRGDAPDLSDIVTPFNQQQMLAIVEKHSRIEGIPWATLFPTKEQEKQWAKEDATAAKRAAEIADEYERDDTDDDTDDDGGEEEVVGCDACNKPHPISANKCPHCGHVYDVEDEPDDEDEEEEEKPAPIRPRSQAKGGGKGGGGKPAPAPEPDDDTDDADDDDDDDADDTDDADDDNQDDDIPF